MQSERKVETRERGSRCLCRAERKKEMWGIWTHGVCGEDVENARSEGGTDAEDSRSSGVLGSQIRL